MRDKQRPSRPGSTTTDRVITQTIRAALVAVGLEPEEFYGRLGISRTTWYNKIGGESHWTADEVQRAGFILGMEVGDLYAGRVPAVSATWGGRDSNPQPDGIGVQLDLWQDCEEPAANLPMPRSPDIIDLRWRAA